MKMEKNGLIETKLFHFHRMFKNGGQGGGSSDPPEPPIWTRPWYAYRVQDSYKTISFPPQVLKGILFAL